MMTSDMKSVVPSLISYIRSDLYTIDNISSSVTLSVPTKEVVDDGSTSNRWECVISYLPLESYKIIEAYGSSTTGIRMVRTEKFDKKYARNPKLYAYDKYGSTNMWRLLMILNRCASILEFDFDYIRYYDAAALSSLMSVLIARSKQNE